MEYGRHSSWSHYLFRFGAKSPPNSGSIASFEYAHELGMATILWCYLRNSGFKKDGTDYHAAADLTGQANHIGVTIKADIVKQNFRPIMVASKPSASEKQMSACIQN